MTDIPDSAQTPDSSDASNVPGTPNSQELPSAPDSPSSLEVPSAPASSNSLEVQKSPDTSNTSDASNMPGVPNSQDVPKSPDAQNAPNVPNATYPPKLPDVPNLPGSGRNERFSLDQALKLGWDNTWKYFMPLIGITTATFLLGCLPSVFTTVVMWVNASPGLIAVSLLVSMFGLVLQEVINMGMINVQLRILDGHPVQTKDVFAVFNKVWNYIGASILYKLMVAGGIICFVVPGIILHLTFQFYGYFIVEHGMGPLQALKASSRIASGSKMDLFMLAVVQTVIGSFGTMILFIGSFPAGLINSIATASVYRQLLKHTPSLNVPALEMGLPLAPEIAETA